MRHPALYNFQLKIRACQLNIYKSASSVNLKCIYHLSYWFLFDFTCIYEYAFLPWSIDLNSGTYIYFWWQYNTIIATTSNRSLTKKPYIIFTFSKHKKSLSYYATGQKKNIEFQIVLLPWCKVPRQTWR